MQMTLCNATCVGNAANCLYPNKVVVADAVSMESVIEQDHVCAVYKGNRRSNDNFIESDVIPIQEKDLPLLYMLIGAEKYLAFAMKRRDYKYITSALNVAKSMLGIKVSDLDKNPNLLNTPRATYNLELGMAGEQPHDPFDLITKITECSPGDEGMDIWLEALDTFFCGDTELIEYVQKVIGLAAIGKVYEEFIIIAYGDGANPSGKRQSEV